MHKRLKNIRNRLGLTQQEAADAMGISLGQYRKLENNQRRFSDHYLDKATRAFGVSASEFVADQGSVPLMGYVGAGAEIEPDFEQIPDDGLELIDVPIAVPDEMVGFMIRGDSQMPRYDEGDVVICYRNQRRGLESFLGEEAVVRLADGRRFLKTIMRTGDGISLFSWNAKPIDNVSIVWIGEIWLPIRSRQFRQMVR